MAALTAPRNTEERIPKTRVFEVAATIFAGSLVALNAEGRAVPAADTAGLKVAGRAENNAAAGERVEVTIGCFEFAATGITAADIGVEVFAVDDQTVAKTSTNSVSAGTVFAVDADGVWININN